MLYYIPGVGEIEIRAHGLTPEGRLKIWYVRPYFHGLDAQNHTLKVPLKWHMDSVLATALDRTRVGILRGGTERSVEVRAQLLDVADALDRGKDLDQEYQVSGRWFGEKPEFSAHQKRYKTLSDLLRALELEWAQAEPGSPQRGVRHAYKWQSRTPVREIRFSEDGAATAHPIPKPEDQEATA
jgi:hypothetical protein